MNWGVSVDHILRSISRRLTRIGVVKSLLHRFYSGGTGNLTAFSESLKFRPIPTVVSLVFFLLILSFVSSRITYYLAGPGELYSRPDVFNLTSAGIKWDVYYGPTKLCGGRDCLLEPEARDADFTKQMVLPAREFPLAEYQKGQMIYARTRLTLPDSLLATNTPIVFHSYYVWAKEYHFYLNGIELAEGSSELLNIPLPRSLIPPDHRLDIAFKIDPGDLPYQGVANRGDLVIGPKSVLERIEFDAEEQGTTYYLLFLLPKATFCLVFILLFLCVSQSPATFYFITFGFLSCVELFLASDYHLVLPEIANYEILALCARSFSALFFIMFLSAFFRRRDQSWQTFLRIGLATLSAISILCLAVMPPGLGYHVAEAVSVLLKFSGIVYGCYLAFFTFLRLTEERKTQMRALVSLLLFGLFAAASALALKDTVAMVLDAFGINNNWSLNLTWIFDLALFLALSGVTAIEFGLTLTAKQQIQSELSMIEQRLELAQSVQSHLMPKDMQGDFGSLGYNLYYEPAEKMAGDWLHIWNTGDGNVHILMGDVVGKGPQAALAVSAIASVLTECKTRGFSLQESIDRININLRELFGGAINTTLSAISFLTPERVLLTCAGSPGWVVLPADAAPRVIPLRGAPLGMSETVTSGTMELELRKGDKVFAFTDGCIDGSRAVKKMLSELKAKAHSERLDANAIYRLVVDAGRDSAQTDDKTMIVISASAEGRQAA